MFTIFFALFENKIINKPNTYKATIQYVGTVDFEAVLNRMENEGLLVPKANALPILNSFFKAVGGYLLEGFKVNTPFINFEVSIKGQFKGSNDSFDPKRHTLAMLTAPNKDYSTEITKQAHIERKESKLPRPNLSTYTDRVSQIENQLATPGGMARLTGYRLKFDETDPQQGIFFIAADGTETKVDPLDVGQNTPKLLVFGVPPLSPGTYQLAIRSLFGTQSLRTGILPKPLVVK